MCFAVRDEVNKSFWSMRSGDFERIDGDSYSLKKAAGEM